MEQFVYNASSLNNIKVAGGNRSRGWGKRHKRGGKKRRGEEQTQRMGKETSRRRKATKEGEEIGSAKRDRE